MRVEEYLEKPCASLAIPFWKHNSMDYPDDVQVIHSRDFAEDLLHDYTDERYFRLIHTLASIPDVKSPDYFVVTATANDIPTIVDLINKSYRDLSVTCEQLVSYTKTPVYDSSLWILICEIDTGVPVACGIADWDRDLSEGILEWIQVLPAYRGRGIGKFVVSELLGRLRNKASFVTVSGKLDSAANPEKLYRKCGFQGEDIWHVLRPKGG